MIRSLLRLLGAEEDAHPEPFRTRMTYSPTDAELRYERARQETERIIAQAEQETNLSHQRIRVTRIHLTLIGDR